MADERIRKLEIMIRLIDIEIILARRREGRQDQTNRRRRKRQVGRIIEKDQAENFGGQFDFDLEFGDGTVRERVRGGVLPRESGGTGRLDLFAMGSRGERTEVG